MSKILDEELIGLCERQIEFYQRIDVQTAKLLVKLAKFQALEVSIHRSEIERLKDELFAVKKELKECKKTSSKS